MSFMRLSRDSTIDTLLIVAGLLLGAREFISLVKGTAFAFISCAEPNMLSEELVRVLQRFSGGPSIQLMVAAVMVVRPTFIRTGFLLLYSDSARFFDTGAKGFWLRCVQTAGFVVVIRFGVPFTSFILRGHSSPAGAIVFDALYCLAFFSGCFSVLFGMLAVFAPDWTSEVLGLEYAEAPVSDSTDLGDLHLRRSGILVACWLILFNALLDFGPRTTWLLQNRDGQLWSEASFVVATLVTLAGFAVWWVRGWLADSLAERDASICTVCGCRFVDACSSCPECDGGTVGFTNSIEKPDLLRVRNWVGLLTAAVVVIAAPESARTVYLWYDYLKYSNLPLLPTGWFAAWSVVAVVLLSLLVPLRRYAVRLLPRSTFHCETLFRFCGLLILFWGVEQMLFSAGMACAWHGPIVGWQAHAVGAVVRLVSGLLLLRWPAARFPGRGTRAADATTD